MTRTYSNKKVEYIANFQRMLSTYQKCLLITCDNVGSDQLQSIRADLRGEAEMLMGKNSMMRKAVSLYLEANPGHPTACLMDQLKGNVGFVFSNGNLASIRKRILSYKKPAPARIGSIAPQSVVVPPGPTGCDPGQTSFFQAMSVPTKIIRGQIEIVSHVHLITAGDKVLPGQAALLDKLGIHPFAYSVGVPTAYDNGTIFNAVVLDLTEEDLKSKFLNGVRKVASLSLAIGYPTLASVPHSIVNAFKKVLSIVVNDSVDYTFPEAEPVLAYLADPSAFAVAAPAADDAAPAVEEEESSSEAEAGVGGLFGAESSTEEESSSEEESD